MSSRAARHGLALIVLLCLLLLGGSAEAEPVQIGRTPGTDLFPKADLLEDRAGTLSIADVTSAAVVARFHHSSPNELNVGTTGSAWWMRVELAPQREDNGVFVRAFHTVGDLQVFVDEGSGPSLIGRLGRERPFLERSILHRQLYAPLTLHAGKGARLYVRLQSKDTLQLRLHVMSGEAVASDVGNDRLIAGLYLGLIGALTLYNFFFFLGLRDRTYAYYVLFQAFTGLLQAGFDQITFQYLWPGSPTWAWWSESAFAGMALFGAAGFQRSFLTLPRAPAPGSKLLKVVQWSSLLMVLGAPLIDHPFFSLWAVGQVFVGCSVMFVCALWALRRGVPSARYLLAGWTAFLATTCVACLTSAGLIPLVDFSEHATRIGSSAEAILLSLGLAHRVNVLRRTNERIRSDMLSQRLASLSTLMSGVVHEIANPLTFVTGGAVEVGRRARRVMMLLAEREAEGGGSTPPALDQEVAAMNEGVSLVQSGAARIEGIVSNLRVDVAGHAVVLEETDVARVIEETLAQVRPRLAQKSVSVTLLLAPMPSVRSRPGELGQVVMNLLLNAVDASPQGGSLRVEGRREAGAVVLTVRDAGPGVPASIREAIFDPFFTTRPQGTGLGLFVSQQIVARHGGELRVLEVDQGAAFELRLPLAGEARMRAV